MKTPQVGDKFFDGFESDYPYGNFLIIEEVGIQYDNGGYEIVVDHTGYDCLWSEKYQIFCYALE